jgi:phage shock protein PspC (stress-responsive transcriptional regulator)
MVRSFTDRVLGGVCGGLGALMPVSPWVFRAAFVVLSVLSGGAFALLYLMIWLLVPQQTLTGRQRGGAGRFLLVIILFGGTLAGWLASLSGGLQGPAGESLYGAGLLVVAAAIFFMRQVRG